MCERGHFLCAECAKESVYFLRGETGACPICKARLHEGTYTPPTAFGELKRDVFRWGWRMQFRWLATLIRNPDLLVGAVISSFAIGTIVVARGPETFAQRLVSWIVDTLFLSIGPLLVASFLVRRRSGTRMIEALRRLFTVDRNQAVVIAATVSMLLFIRIFILH